jgi:hypothetical protein
MAAAISFAMTNPVNKGRDQYLNSMHDFTPSTSYPALGEPVTAAQFGLNRIIALYATVADGSRLVTFDPTNQTIRIWTALGTEAGTGTDQSSKVLRVIVFGL